MNCFKKGLLVCLTMASLLVIGTVVQAGGVLLKQGMQGNEVKLLQTELKKLGYFKEEPSGFFGEITKQALMKYQKDRKFSVDGVAGPAVWSALVGNDKLPGLTQKSTTSDTTVQNTDFSSNLHKGDQGASVKAMQSKLSDLGYLTKDSITGYFGQITESAVIKYQKANGSKADGIVGKGTWGILFGTAKATSTKRTEVKVTSRSEDQRGQALIPWDEAQKIFTNGTDATIIDIGTGIKFNIRRSYGYNHADCETLTYEDTQAMKKAFGGSWNWDRRPIVLVVNGRWLAASMAGMPHAGIDNEPALATVPNRSGGFGAGQNLDVIKGNDMNGHFDVHFLGSRTHGTDKIDTLHQAAVKKAVAYIEGR